MAALIQPGTMAPRFQQDCVPHTHTKIESKTKYSKDKVCQVGRKRNPSNFGSTTLESVKNQKLLPVLWEKEDL